MSVLLKLAGLGLAVGGGSLLMSWLALVGTAALTIAVIVLLTRETRLTDQVQR